MNLLKCIQKWDEQQAARDRRDRIQAHREEIVSKQPKLDIKRTRIFTQNGRIVTELTIDGSREYGRGYSYKLVCGGCT